MLVDLGFIDRERALRAIEEGRVAGKPPERVLLDSGAISSEQLSRAIAERYGLDHVDLGVLKVDMAAVNLLAAVAARRYGAVPIAFLGEPAVLLAMSDPANVLAIDDIARLTRMEMKPAVPTRSARSLRTTASSTSPIRSRAQPASVSTHTSSARRWGRRSG